MQYHCLEKIHRGITLTKTPLPTEVPVLELRYPLSTMAKVDLFEYGEL